MAALWSDLSRNSEEFEPPQWHREALEETERLIAEGKETFMDWEESKRMLREN